MASKKIHINQHNIKANSKAGNKRLPVISVKEGRDNTYGNEVDVNGPCRVIYSPDKPLSCGAKVWIETDADVDIRQKRSKGRSIGENPRADLVVDEPSFEFGEDAGKGAMLALLSIVGFIAAIYWMNKNKAQSQLQVPMLQGR